MTPMLEKLSPILPSRDLAAAESFWSRLGFATVHLDPEEYLLMKREEAELHFFAHPDLDPARNDHGAYLRPSDIRALHAEWTALGPPDRGTPRYVALEDMPWGTAELALIDPDGNFVRAGKEIPLG